MNFISKIDFDYFAFCDSDDLWDESWLSKLTSCDSKYDLVYSNGYELLHSKTSSQTKLKPVSSSYASYKKDAFSSKLYLGSALFSSNLLVTQANFLDTSLAFHYDIELFLRLSAQNLTYIHYSDHLFYYRVHPGNLSSKLYLSTLRERWLITKKLDLSMSIFYSKFIYYYRFP